MVLIDLLGDFASIASWSHPILACAGFRPFMPSWACRRVASRARPTGLMLPVTVNCCGKPGMRGAAQRSADCSYIATTKINDGIAAATWDSIASGAALSARPTFSEPPTVETRERITLPIRWSALEEFCERFKNKALCWMEPAVILDLDKTAIGAPGATTGP